MHLQKQKTKNKQNKNPQKQQQKPHKQNKLLKRKSNLRNALAFGWESYIL